MQTSVNTNPIIERHKADLTKYKRKTPLHAYKNEEQTGSTCDHSLFHMRPDRDLTLISQGGRTDVSRQRRDN